MARPGRPERNETVRSFRQIRRFLHVINSNNVFGTHRIAQTAKASKSCLAKFRQKFGDDKGHNYSVCMTDQTNKAIDDCVGSSEFSNCVLEKSLRVLEVCDLSNC